MTTDQTPEQTREERIKGIVGKYVSEAWEKLFDQLDQLHAQDINDNDVVRALRALDETELAQNYIDWGDIIDPDREGNETLDTVIPDPADSPSYKGLWEGDKPAVPPLQDQLENVARIREAHAKTFAEARREMQWP